MAKGLSLHIMDIIDEVESEIELDLQNRKKSQKAQQLEISKPEQSFDTDDKKECEFDD